MPLTRTYLDVTTGDVESVIFRRVPGGWSISASSIVRADDGTHYRTSLTKDATANQATQAETFITNHLVASFNVQEGLA